MSPENTDILTADAVRLGLKAISKNDALMQCGSVLVDIGAAGPEYAEAMIEREKSVSTFMGEGVAIPHGTDASREHITKAALAVLQFPDGVDWNGNMVNICIAIASKSNEHVGILQRVASVLSDREKARALREAKDPAEVVELLNAPAYDEDDDDD